MSGSGRKVFQPGEVLTASNVQNYLQDQAVMVFAGTAARGTALGAGTVSAGMMSYLQDTNTVEVYKTSGTAIAGWEPPGVQSPNVIINGGFDIFQRGTFNSQTTGGYALDRWFGSVGGTATITQQTTGVPLGSQYCARIAYNAASSFSNFGQALEADMAKQLTGKTVTVSGKLRRSSTFAANIYVILEKNSTANTYAGGAWSNISYIEIPNSSLPTGTATSDWYSFSFTATVPNDGSANGVRVRFAEQDAGPSGAYWEVAQVQLEIGQTATPFRRNANSIQGELAACQRYYCQFDFSAYYSTGPGLVATKWSTTDAVVGQLQWPVEMRVAPAITRSSTTARFVASSGVGTVNVGTWAISTKMATISYTNNSFGAGYGWLDSAGIFYVSAEL